MDDIKSKSELPKKPEWFMWTVAKSAAFFAATFALIQAIGSKTPILRKLITDGSKEAITYNAVIGGVAGAVFGAMEGASNQTKYQVEVETAPLKAALKKAQANASFAGREEEKKSCGESAAISLIK